MKKYLTFLVFIISVLGCDNPPSNQQKSNKLLIETGVEVNGYVVSVVNIEGCEYLVSGIGYSQMITHKGNCKNPIHLYKESYVWHIDRFIPDTTHR